MTKIQISKQLAFDLILDFGGWFYLRPFCWVSLTEKRWLKRRLG